MKAIYQFFRTTLVGGILFLVPLIAIVVIVGKAMSLTHKLIDPLTAHLPFESLIGLPAPVFLAAFLVVSMCFVAGLLAKTSRAQKWVTSLEGSVLSKVPGYSLLKSAGASMLGAEASGSYPVVFVDFGDSTQLGLQTDVLPNGQITVFIPGSPDPQAGAVHFVTADRVKPAGLTLADAMKCLKNYGGGTRALLAERSKIVS